MPGNRQAIMMPLPSVQKLILATGFFWFNDSVGALRLWETL